MGSPVSISSHRASPLLDLDYIDQAMTFTPSERCTMSCGTVCIDPNAEKVLIIFNRRLGIWQLPKGRKNIGEGLHSAALRETYEETGVRADLLPLMVQTRSTKPLVESESVSVPVRTSPGGPGNTVAVSSVPAAYSILIASSTATFSSTTTAVENSTEAVPVKDPKVTSDRLNNEPVGIVQYPDLQVSTPDTTKTVFFFAACADSTLPMGAGAQEEHEDLLAEWVAFHIADQRLRFGPEKQVMWKVKSDLARTGSRS